MRGALLLAILLGLAPAAWAQDPAASIRAVISQQIEAMRADDFATAFTFASPEIQRMFGSPGRFGEMVREGYPMVWHPRDVRFLDAVTEGGGMVQGVLVTDEAGRCTSSTTRWCRSTAAGGSAGCGSGRPRGGA